MKKKTEKENPFVQEYKKLVGFTLIRVEATESDSAAMIGDGPIIALDFIKGVDKKTFLSASAFVLRDPEGNGPGFLEISPIVTRTYEG